MVKKAKDGNINYELAVGIKVDKHIAQSNYNRLLTEVNDEKKSYATYSIIDFGNYYALVIGNNKYKFLSSLSNAVNDANAIAEVLREKFNYNTLY